MIMAAAHSPGNTWGCHVYRDNPVDRSRRNRPLIAAGYRYRCRHCGELLRTGTEAMRHLRDAHGLPFGRRKKPLFSVRTRRGR